MVVLCTRLPCESRTTTLQPVRNPGSMAITRFCPSGAERSSCPQVFGEYPDCLVVGLLFGGREQLGLYRRSDEPLERVGHGGLHICARCRSGTYEPAAERFGDALRVGIDRDAQDPLVFAATHGQEPVRRDAAQRRRGVEVVRILRSLGLLALHELRVHRPFASIVRRTVLRACSSSDILSAMMSQAPAMASSGVATSAVTKRCA